MEDRSGQKLGNYRLLRLLGHGGFAEVYLGEHTHLNTYAAVKVLHTQWKPDDLAMFQAEARTIAHLDHPHIVRVLEFGLEDGTTPFLVMAYAPNGTLRQRHSNGLSLPLTTILSYVDQVSSALHYAHNQGLIHRDVKPENMLLGCNDTLLLSDFGLAVMTQRASSPLMEFAAGTVAYMAPEQIQAHPRPASDQYALGIAVYEWLSGSRPFQGTFTEIAAKHCLVQPPSLRERIPTISPEVEQVVLTALAKDPRRRFDSVQTFANALKQACRTTPILLAPVVPVSGGASYQSTFSNPIDAPTLSALTPVGVASRQNTTRSSFPASQFVTTSTAPASPRHFAYGRIPFFIGLLFLILLTLGSSLWFVHRSSPVAVKQTQAQSTYPPATATFLATHPNPYPPHTGKLVLNDALDTNDNGQRWYEPFSPYLFCRFPGHGFHLYAEKGQQGTTCPALNTDFSNFAFQVEMRFVNGSIQNPSITGIIFRETNTFMANERSYIFSIQEDGTYRFDACGNFNCKTLLDSTCCLTNFHIGLNVSNVFAVVANNATFDIYMNGTHVAGPIHDTTAQHGSIGFSLTSGRSHDVEVVYSHVKVWKL